MSGNDNGGPVLGPCLLHSIGSIDNVNLVPTVFYHCKLHSIIMLYKIRNGLVAVNGDT